MFLQALAAWLWWGPLRRPFEAFARRLLKPRSRIMTGPLKGYRFSGGLAQVLGIYEIEVQQALIDHVCRGSVVYDIGANNGFFTLLAAKLSGPEGHVYAFEPFPQNAEKIERAVEANHVSNCTVLAQAVAEVSGEAALHFETASGMATPTLLNGRGQQVLNVQTIALDDFVTPENWPDLIKVDVEGAEELVLRGASRLFDGSKPPPVWIIETHSPETDRSVRDILTARGYHIGSLPRSRADRCKAFPSHILAAR